MRGRLRGGTTYLLVWLVVLFVVVGVVECSWPFYKHDAQGTNKAGSKLNFALQNGTETWRYSMADGSTKVLVDSQGNLYIPSSFDVESVNPQGARRWKTLISVGGNAPPSFFLSEDDGLLYVGSGTITALRMSDGAEVWTTNPTTLTLKPPSYFQMDPAGTLLFGYIGACCSDTISALDLNNQSIVWQYQLPDSYVINLLVGRDVVAVVALFNAPTYAYQVIYLEPKTGKLISSATSQKLASQLTMGSAAMDETTNAVFVRGGYYNESVWNPRGWVSRWDINNAHMSWSAVQSSYHTDNGIALSSPDGLVVVPYYDGVDVLNLQTGALVWKASAVTLSGVAIDATPTLYTLGYHPDQIVGRANTLAAFALSNGNVLFTQDLVFVEHHCTSMAVDPALYISCPPVLLSFSHSTSHSTSHSSDDDDDDVPQWALLTIATLGGSLLGCCVMCLLGLLFVLVWRRRQATDLTERRPLVN